MRYALFIGRGAWFSADLQLLGGHHGEEDEEEIEEEELISFHCASAQERSLEAFSPAT